MLFIVILLTVVFALLAWMKARGKRVPAAVVAVAGIAALSFAVLYAFKSPAAAPVSSALGSGGDGALLGRALADSIPGGGELLVLHRPDPSKGLSGIAERQMDGLAAGAGRKFRMTRESCENFTPEFCRALLARHPGACAMVSFIGLPDAPPEEWPANAPPLYAFGFATDLKKDGWRQSDRLKALVVFRQRPTDGGKPSGSPATADDLYERMK
jgi:hypothetical protein